MEFRIGNVESAIIDDLKQDKDSALLKKVLINNKIYSHNNKEEHKETFVCELEGCNTEYEITIHPHQVLYPKYCEQHRNSFKRELHLEHLNQISKK